ncbi:hypothetical protein RIF29_30162 [Crotalaria pallida]|uniref:Phytochrome chromophore attachment site domain-containing protein n=1 Tax=Crotalaria pallida TaxID=3830 RepID=A0AAN9HWU5_CROPI
MVYQFHDDEHGEVIAESKRDDLELYIGLHYPATNIPQALWFLFKQNRVRMIVDCHASPVRVVPDKALAQPLCLVGSTLCAPHGCHAQYMANMGFDFGVVIEYGTSIGGAVVEETSLWDGRCFHHGKGFPFLVQIAHSERDQIGWCKASPGGQG